MKKKKKNIIILSILIAVLILGAGFIVKYYIKESRADNEYKEMKDKAKVTVQEEKKVKEKPYKSPINFEELWKTNSEIYAWIRIPGTEIDYPVAQRTDDDTYYLNHAIEGTEGLPGSIYTEAINSKEFTDFNTVIYGHNMKNGTMFAGLHKYEDKEFFKLNPYVYLYLPDKTLKYQIFAAVVFDDRHVMYNFDYSTPEGCQAFLDEIKAIKTTESNYDEQVTVGTDSNIITLATCIGGKPENRWLVEAVLIEDEAE